MFTALSTMPREQFPQRGWRVPFVRSRSTGVTLARSISDPLAGLTPLIASALLASLGYAAVASFLLVTVLIALAAVALGPETQKTDIEKPETA